MKQQIVTLSGKTKALVIPNTILKQLNDPDGFEMVIVDGKLVLNPFKKKEGKADGALVDQSIDMYSVG